MTLKTEKEIFPREISGEKQLMEEKDLQATEQNEPKEKKNLLWCQKHALNFQLSPQTTFSTDVCFAFLLNLFVDVSGIYFCMYVVCTSKTFSFFVATRKT